MRLSESLRRGILESTVGGIINRFKIRSKRRDTLFFEELMARYIQECEKAGYSEETGGVGEEWGYLVYKILIADSIKKIPITLLFNSIIRKVWHNLGLIDDLRLEKNNDSLRLSTKNETMTRTIGTNRFMPGFYTGTFEALLNSHVHPVDIFQSKERCEYAFKLDGKPAFFEGKPKELYRKLNDIGQIEGYTLKDALKRNIFELTDNRIYFRGKSVSPVENTIFHIMGIRNIAAEKMAETSYDFFSGVVEKNAGKERKLSVLKTVFQIMGWGRIRILAKEKGTIVIEIKNPPYGLTPEDNWQYLFRVFLGYLWMIDKSLKISDVKKAGKCVSVKYSR